MRTIDRRSFLTGAAAGAALLTLPRFAADAAGKPDLEPIYAEIARRKDEATARLQDWIRKPAIVAEHRGVEEGCAYMKKLCREAGFQKVTRIATKGSPAVLARLEVGARRSLGLYFMYDVKQVVESEWSSPPFAANLVDLKGVGKVVMGRGAVNQKGPEACFLAALHAIRGAGRKLPVNLVLVAEGEEEEGSPHLPDVVHHPEVQAALRTCQAVMLPSADQNLGGTPSVTLGGKGLLQVELSVSGEKWGRGPSREIHSGMRPAVDSPAWHLVQALHTLVTEDGNDPAIDGIDAMVRPLSRREKDLIADAVSQLDEASMKRDLAVKRWARDVPFRDVMERISGRPTVNIQGLVAGYPGPGGKTIVPHRAAAKLDIRLVPNMKMTSALAALRAHLDKRGYAGVEITNVAGYDPTTTSYDAPPVQAALSVYREAGLRPVVRPRGGGSWPGCLFTEKPLGLPAVIFGLGHGQGAHAKNEYFLIDSERPKVRGIVGAVRSYVDFLFEFAAR
jgi:acetylornithine deacetylase/succinyl-diaminopimelate desuccinylase-like protein